MTYFKIQELKCECGRIIKKEIVSPIDSANAKLNKWYIILPVYTIISLALGVLGYQLGKQDKEIELFVKYKNCYIDQIGKDIFNK